MEACPKAQGPCIFCGYSFSTSTNARPGALDNDVGVRAEASQEEGRSEGNWDPLLKHGASPHSNFLTLLEEAKLSFDFDPEIISELVKAVCPECTEMINVIAARRHKVLSVEKQVRCLQKEVLDTMKDLEGCLDLFHSELKWLAVSVTNSDVGCLENYVKMGRYVQEVFTLRDGIVTVFQDLTIFRNDLDMRTKCDGGVTPRLTFKNVADLGRDKCVRTKSASGQKIGPNKDPRDSDNTQVRDSPATRKFPSMLEEEQTSIGVDDDDQYFQNDVSDFNEEVGSSDPLLQPSLEKMENTPSEESRKKKQRGRTIKSPRSGRVTSYPGNTKEAIDSSDSDDSDNQTARKRTLRRRKKACRLNKGFHFFDEDESENSAENLSVDQDNEEFGVNRRKIKRARKSVVHEDNSDNDVIPKKGSAGKRVAKPGTKRNTPLPTRIEDAIDADKSLSLWKRFVLRKLTQWTMGKEAKDEWMEIRRLKGEYDGPDQESSSPSDFFHYDATTGKIFYHGVAVIFDKEDPNILKCCLCDYTTPVKVNPKEQRCRGHRNVGAHIHGNHLGPFTCIHCGMDYKGVKGLKQHLQLHKENGPECDICGKPLLTSSINSHRLLHMNAEEKMEAILLMQTKKGDGISTGKCFKCSTCGKILSSKRYLEIHQNAHSHAVSGSIDTRDAIGNSDSDDNDSQTERKGTLRHKKKAAKLSDHFHLVGKEESESLLENLSGDEDNEEFLGNRRKRKLGGKPMVLESSSSNEETVDNDNDSDYVHPEGNDLENADSWDPSNDSEEGDNESTKNDTKPSKPKRSRKSKCGAKPGTKRSIPLPTRIVDAIDADKSSSPWKRFVLRKLAQWTIGNEAKDDWAEILRLKTLMGTNGETEQESSPSDFFHYNSLTGEAFYHGVAVIFDKEDPNILQCCLCDYKTPVKVNPKELRCRGHRNMGAHIHGNHLGPFTCIHCGVEYRGFKGLKQHLPMHDKNCPECDICGKPLTNRSINGHKLLHMNEEEKKEALRRLQTKRATPVKHKTKTGRPTSSTGKSFQCATCGKRVSTRRNLEKHENTHLDQDETVVCAKCGLEMPKKRLARHERSNCSNVKGAIPSAGDRPRMKCVYCEVTLKNELQLKLHITRKHSQAATDRPFKCTLCPKDFKVKPDLRRHYKEVHKLYDDDQSSTPAVLFKCEKCYKEFGVRRYWKRHVAGCVHGITRRSYDKVTKKSNGG